jgi:8-oxo-dGTP pyrophosphatase MutT (NUDIX family)
MNLSDIKQKLPTTIGINGEDEYFRSVVLLLLISIEGEWHIVFQKRAAGIRQGGEISLPGGQADASDKRPQDTAIRETQEELGIPANKIQILGQLDTVLAPYGVMVEVFVGYADIQVTDMKLNNEEVEYVFSVPLSYFLNNQPEQYEVKTEIHPTTKHPETDEEIVLFPTKTLNIPVRYHKAWGHYHSKVYVYQVNGEVIWGITARIVKDFSNKIQK